MKWKLTETLADDPTFPERNILTTMEFDTPYDAFNSLRSVFYMLRNAGLFVSIGGTGAEPNATIYLPKGSVIWTMKQI